MEDVNVKSFKHVKKGSQRRHQELGWLKDIGRQKKIGTKSKPEAMAAPPMQELVAWIALGLRFDDSIPWQGVQRERGEQVFLSQIFHSDNTNNFHGHGPGKQLRYMMLLMVSNICFFFPIWGNDPI